MRFLNIPVLSGGLSGLSRASFALAGVLALGGGLFGAATQTQAQEQRMASATMIVFDSSGSMWQETAGLTKYQIASQVVTNFMRAQSSSNEIGLLAYGHRRKGDCSDIETLVPVGTNTANRIIEAVNNINPRGRTPLTDSIRRAASELGFADRAAQVVVITDGLETCGQDPCAAAAELEAQGLNFTASVVGFGVAGLDTASLQCIADATGGQFLTADNADQLLQSLEQIAGVDPEELRAAQEEAQRLRGAFDRAQGEINDLERRLADARDELARKDAELQQARDAIGNVDQALADAREQLARKEAELLDAIDRINDLEAELAAKQRELDDLKAALERANQDNAALSDLVDGLQEQLKTLQDQNAALREEAADIKKAYDEQRQENEDLRRQLEAALAELEDCQEEKAALEQELERLQAVYGDQQGVLTTLQDQLKQCKDSEKDLKAQLEELAMVDEDALRRLAESNKQLILSRRALERDLGDIIQIIKLLEAADRLADRVQTSNMENTDMLNKVIEIVREITREVETAPDRQGPIADLQAGQ